MKRISIVILSLFIFCLSINATINNSFSTINSFNYTGNVNHFDMYFKSNVPFEYKNNKLYINSNYSSSGLLNIKEYDLSIRENDSYLVDGSSYFTMTENGNDIYY